MTWRERIEIAQDGDEFEKAVVAVNFARFVAERFPSFDFYSEDRKREIRESLLDREVDK